MKCLLFVDSNNKTCCIKKGEKQGKKKIRERG